MSDEEHMADVRNRWFSREPIPDEVARMIMEWERKWDFPTGHSLRVADFPPEEAFEQEHIDV